MGSEHLCQAALSKDVYTMAVQVMNAYSKGDTKGQKPALQSKIT